MQREVKFFRFFLESFPVISDMVTEAKRQFSSKFKLPASWILIRCDTDHCVHPSLWVILSVLNTKCGVLQQDNLASFSNSAIS